jgi:dTDP-4-amino-4,6-dideoxygalactose transaminase
LLRVASFVAVFLSPWYFISMNIPFSKISCVGNEEKYLLESLQSGKWSGRGPKTLALEKLVTQLCEVKHAFFVTSGTAALEIGALLARLQPGDEVITPSFAFLSSANAIALRGAKPVFADIDKNLWNITVETVEPLITKKTKAILPIYYGGSSAGADDLRKLCKERNLFFIEDAAQALGGKRNGKPIGSSDDVACFSLHDTKNVSSGEGGLITTDSDELAKRIEILIEKGANRQQFFRGQIDKYRWVDIGSSYVGSDLLAAIALAQFERLAEVTEKRKIICSKLKNGFQKFEGKLQWQNIPTNIETNGHLCAFVIDPKIRDQVLSKLKVKGVIATFHYVPLHDAPFAKEMGFDTSKDLVNTRYISEGLIRLPVFYSMNGQEIDYIIDKTSQILSEI